MLEKRAKALGAYLPGRRSNAQDHLQVITVINFKDALLDRSSCAEHAP